MITIPELIKKFYHNLMIKDFIIDLFAECEYMEYSITKDFTLEIDKIELEDYPENKRGKR